jgi:hypothetical protein
MGDSQGAAGGRQPQLSPQISTQIKNRLKNDPATRRQVIKRLKGGNSGQNSLNPQPEPPGRSR